LGTLRGTASSAEMEEGSVRILGRRRTLALPFTRDAMQAHASAHLTRQP
jgi:hypothetical protein